MSVQVGDDLQKEQYLASRDDDADGGSGGKCYVIFLFPLEHFNQKRTLEVPKRTFPHLNKLFVVY